MPTATLAPVQLPPCTVGNRNQFCAAGGGNAQTCRCIAPNTLTCDAYTGWTCQPQGFTPDSVQVGGFCGLICACTTTINTPARPGALQPLQLAVCLQRPDSSRKVAGSVAAAQSATCLRRKTERCIPHSLLSFYLTFKCDSRRGLACPQALCGQQNAPSTCGTTPPDSPFTTCSCQGGTCFPGGKCQYPCGFIGAPSNTCEWAAASPSCQPDVAQPPLPLACARRRGG